MRILWLLLVISLLGALDVPKNGDRVLPLSLPDQYGHLVTVDKDVRFLLYIPDKGASEIAKAFLKSKDAKYINDKKLAVISDLSGVPSFIRSAFIIPDLQNYPYTMLVIEDEFSPVIFESDLGKVSVVFIDNGRQKKVQKAASVEAIEMLINYEENNGKDN